MHILLLGSGGREHAFAWKLAQSPLVEALYVAPGNAGTAQVAQNIDISVTDFEGIAQFCEAKQITHLLVGPEEPLVKGIKNFFAQHPTLSGLHVIGPDRAGAQLEGSKDFAKQFMMRHNIPTAQSQTFVQQTLNEALTYIDSRPAPYVIKADGLAAGKGVVIAQSKDEAKATLEAMLVDHKFGEASQKVVIEDFLQGIELSVFIITDGQNYYTLPEAKDYKRIGEGDTGPNTGGMGAVSPVPFADKAFMQKVDQRIIRPTLDGLRKEGIHYTGFIFFGLMKVGDDPYVIEYNVRMGDPENEVVMPRIKTDLAQILDAVAHQRLAELPLTTLAKTATTVVLVSGGYPDSHPKGLPIHRLEKVQDALAFHAGTTLDAKGQTLTNGGRVLALTGLGATREEALQQSYNAAEIIQYEGKYYRRDIGQDLA
ncbi:phosphoribosylamine--glycine ligase [Eisenibacter elegans]|jgi:phosphoribosylamine--glycine ligase|uniref:phosphoribosylamine--glycine ligase n=1 Tax=Eisenibacter elegans TaxID=997 RepID=UPI0003FC13EC|nr:phosphoribosylamine--glycine ligase [Eisenibacter elegans]